MKRGRGWEPPFGGIEQNVALFGRGPGGDEDGASRGFWGFAGAVWEALLDCCEESGGYARALRGRSMLGDVFDASGDRLAVESLSDEPPGSIPVTVFEYSTREADAFGATGARGECLRRICAALERSGSAGLTLSAPGLMPRFGRARPFSLAFDVNVSAGRPLSTPEALRSVSTALIAMMPLLSPGGIGLSGRFCISPAASANPEKPSSWNRSAYTAEVRSHTVCTFPSRTERRLHVPLEAGFRGTTASLIAFAAVQAVASMAVGGYLDGVALVNPGLAARRFSSSPDTARCRLSSGKAVALRELGEVILARLDSFLAEHRPPEEMERVIGLLREGLSAISRGHPYQERELLQSFDYFRKRAVFEEVMQRRFGLDAERAQALFQALKALSMPPGRVMGMSVTEAGKTVGAAGGRRGCALAELMRRNSISASDLPRAAGVYKTWEAIELRLYGLWPEPGPLDAEDAATYLLLAPGGRGAPADRAQVRARHVGYLSATGDNHRARADWANMYHTPEPVPGEECVSLYIQPFSEGLHGSSPGPITLIRAVPKDVLRMPWRKRRNRCVADGLAWAMSEHDMNPWYDDYVEENDLVWEREEVEKLSEGDGDPDCEGMPRWFIEEILEKYDGVPGEAGREVEQESPWGEQLTFFDPDDYLQYMVETGGVSSARQYAMFGAGEYRQSMYIITAETAGAARTP